MSEQERAAPWLRRLGIFELVGGVLCLVGSFVPSLSWPLQIHLRIPYVNLFAGVISVMAGLALLSKDVRGIWLSLLVQSAQICNFSVAWRFVYLTGIRFAIVAGSAGAVVSCGGGGEFALTTKPPEAKLDAAGIFGEVHMGYGSIDSSTWVVAVNLIAFVYALRLLWVLLGNEDHDTSVDRALAASANVTPEDPE